MNIQRVFGEGGLIERFLSDFEKRPQQIQMAEAVQKALVDARHMVVEAGTGVGKSFAYLVPAIETIRKTRCVGLISTFTITLQEQLINKDIPFLTNCIPAGFNAVLAKGRSNYLCKRRLDFARQRRYTLFTKSESQLDDLYRWAGQTKDGSLSDLSFVPDPKIWDAVKSEHGNCRSRRCPHFKDCFYQKARRLLETADIIIANHSLLFSDLVLKEQNVSLLPDYDFLIIDEAHNIEHVAENHFGIDISNRKIKFLLNDLYNPMTHKGHLAYTNNAKAFELIAKADKYANLFFKQLSNWYEENEKKTNGRCPPNFIKDTISQYLNDLASHLATLANSADDVDERFELLRFVNKTGAIVVDLQSFIKQKKNDYVYWLESSYGRKTTIRLKSAPINVADDVKRSLFNKYESVVLTSATLSIDSEKAKKGFEFLAGRIGLDDFDALKLGSPFDYSKQVTVYIEKNLPNPNDKAFIAPAAEAIKKYLLKTKGRAFVLFTSYSMLQNMAEELENWLNGNGFEPLCQGSGLDRTVLLNRFKDDNKSVLFGTDSFWQGVDVPGPALSNVIIVKLPFAVPDQPLIAGRIEQLKKQGKNPFYEYQLPLAVIKFKQGFGRLIRKKDDTGIIVILDSRIVKKSYGQKFLNAIPKCKFKTKA